MKLYMLQRSWCDGTDIFGIYDSMPLAISNLIKHYLATGERLDIEQHYKNILYTSDMLYEKKTHFGDKFITKQIEQMRQNIAQAEYDENMRLYGTVDSTKIFTNCVNKLVALSVGTMLVATIGHIIETTEKEGLILQAFDSMFSQVEVN